MGATAAVVGGTLIGGYLQGEATSSAAAAQERAAREQLALQREMWQTAQEQYAPWREAGVEALGGMQAMMQPGYEMTTSPDYQFRMQQGQRALEGAAVARGNLMSGRTLKELTGFGQNLASQEYANRFNRLASLAGIGQTATQGIVGAGQSYATGAGTAYGNMGQARASGYLGQGANQANMLNQLYMYGGQQGWFKPSAATPAPTAPVQTWT